MNGDQVSQALVAAAQAVESSKDLLCALDSEGGDGDHGVSMTIGMRATRQALRSLQSPAPAEVFQAAADAYADEVGAASGIIYELGFGGAAAATRGKTALNTPADWGGVFEAIAEAIRRTGGAVLGDKTMLDAWQPATDALQEAAELGLDFRRGLDRAATAARAGVQQTKNMISKRGRARLAGERTRGHEDPGAMSAYIIIKAISDFAAKLPDEKGR